MTFMKSTVICGCQPKTRGKTPKMDGLFHGKPYEQMDDLGGTPIFGNTHYVYVLGVASLKQEWYIN